MNRLVSYYGDDFTGSTDVMEALASHGVSTVLFTRQPSDREFDPFANYAAIGLAGTSRSQGPEWMDEHLPPALEWLKSLGARFCHYKVCSTFDSGRNVGNIGRAMDIGAQIFAQAVIPLIVGAPQLGRYTFGGNLFADYQGETYRIDRHPVMSCHPVTPMTEADLRLHLAQLTARKVVIARGDWPEQGVALLDVHDSVSQSEAGKQLVRLPARACPFIVGSSGVEYALTNALTASGDISGTAMFNPVAAVPQTVVISGSVSPTTERQIRHALNNGFGTVAVDALRLAQCDETAKAEAMRAALALLDEGKSPIIHTAMGPGTDKGSILTAIPNGRRHIGKGLGSILKAILETTAIRRVIIAGGDSSSHALGQLDIYALTTLMPLPATPGSPLCTAHAGLPALSGLEIALKGGQVGSDSYFSAIRDGTV